MQKSNLNILLAFFLTFCILPLHGQIYPEIKKLAPGDIIFKQVQNSLAQAYKAEKSGKDWPDLFFAFWESDGQEDLFSLAARLTLPYETIAGLNGMSGPGEIKKGELIIIPSIHGLFVPEKGLSDIDNMLKLRLLAEETSPVDLDIYRNGKAERFSFYRAARLYKTERSFFLNAGFRLPLPRAILTSAYGMRKSPFGGHDQMHNGVDLAAPEGTDVLAARAGKVIAIRDDAVLGLMVIIEHDGLWQTVYGHMSRIIVELNQTVLSGTIIGAVGSTGMSTGPHLHFEIRTGGSTRDPSSYIPGIGQ